MREQDSQHYLTSEGIQNKIYQWQRIKVLPYEADHSSTNARLNRKKPHRDPSLLSFIVNCLEIINRIHKHYTMVVYFVLWEVLTVSGIKWLSTSVKGLM